MTNRQFAKFPKETFTAFSTAKLSHFLAYDEETTPATIRHFFGEDFNQLAKFEHDQLSIMEKGQWIKVLPEHIVVRFTNGKYKVIDADYYWHNFNAPMVDEEGRGLN